MTLRFDHAIVAVLDLEAASSDFEQLGFTVVYGGEHDGGLTHNALITFADGTYLEIMAPTDPDLLENPPEPGPGNYLFLFDSGEGFAGYALHTAQLDAIVARLRERGIEISDPGSGGRLRSDGEELKWRTAFPRGSLSPFFLTDDTPRELRVRTESELTFHANGALGITRVFNVVADLEKGVARYSNMLGLVPVRELAVEGATAAKFNLGSLEVIVAAPSDSRGPSFEHFNRRGEGLYQIDIRAKEQAKLETHGARIILAHS